MPESPLVRVDEDFAKFLNDLKENDEETNPETTRKLLEKIKTLETEIDREKDSTEPFMDFF